MHSAGIRSLSLLSLFPSSFPSYPKSTPQFKVALHSPIPHPSQYCHHPLYWKSKWVSHTMWILSKWRCLPGVLCFEEQWGIPFPEWKWSISDVYCGCRRRAPALHMLSICFLPCISLLAEAPIGEHLSRTFPSDLTCSGSSSLHSTWTTPRILSSCLDYTSELEVWF